MNFAISPELTELQGKVREFIATAVMPLESDPRQTPHGPDEALRKELITAAKQAGLLAPHVTKEYGGLG